MFIQVIIYLFGYFSVVLSINIFFFEVYLRCILFFIKKNGFFLKFGDRGINNVEWIRNGQLLYLIRVFGVFWDGIQGLLLIELRLFYYSSYLSFWEIGLKENSL